MKARIGPVAAWGELVGGSPDIVRAGAGLDQQVASRRSPDEKKIVSDNRNSDNRQ
jgi:hypothetical protein